MDRQIKKSANKFAEIVNTNSMFNKNVSAKEAVSTHKKVKAPFIFPIQPSYGKFYIASKKDFASYG